MKYQKNMNNINLSEIGFLNYDLKDFHKKSIILRDGRDAKLWVHKPSGHGILDRNLWEKEDFYEREYRNQFSSNIDGKKQECEEHLKVQNNLNTKQFELFKKFLNKDTKYLEIGCSFGGIVSKVCDYGVKECHVIEPNIEDSNFIKNRYNNVKVFNSLFEDANLEENYYDIIVAFDVLEHVYSPGNFLKKCCFLLKNSGILIIAVPNHNDVLLTTYRSNEYKKFYYHKSHINYFTSSSIKDLCNINGFSGEVESYLDYSFFNHIFWYQNNSPMKSGSTAFIGKVIDSNDIFSEKINKFYKDMESKYEKLINKNIAGGALIFKGMKK